MLSSMIIAQNEFLDAQERENNRPRTEAEILENEWRALHLAACKHHREVEFGHLNNAEYYTGMHKGTISRPNKFADHPGCPKFYGSL